MGVSGDGVVCQLQSLQVASREHDPSSVYVPMDYSTGTPDQLLLAGRDFQG